MFAVILGAVPMLALAARLPLYLIVIAAVLGMCGSLGLSTSRDTVIQQLMPINVHSRFRSYDYMLACTAMPPDAVAGPLESAFGPYKVLIGAAAVRVVANAIPAMLPAVRHRSVMPPRKCTGDSLLSVNRRQPWAKLPTACNCGKPRR